MAGLITGTGKLAAAYEYDPWGKPISVRQDSIVQSLRYGAREYDSATGLYYNRARFYDPDLGRFISEDPIGLAGGINPYAYADGDPANRIDPYGLYSCPAPGRPCPVVLPGIENSWDWLLWEQIFFFRAGPSVGLQGENPGADDIWNGLLAFYLIQMDYEQVREEATEAQSLLETAADFIGSQCAQKLLDFGVGLAGDATFWLGGTVISGGVKAIRSARAATFGKARKAQRAEAGRAMISMGGQVAAVEWIGDPTFTLGMAGASGTLGRAAASGAEWDGFDFASDGLTFYDFVPFVGTTRSGIQALAACGGPDLFALLGVK